MTIFATLTPIDIASGTRVTVRVCGAADEASTGVAGERWWPAMVTLPVIQARFFDGDFTSSVEPPTASIDLRLDVLIASGAFPGVERYDWAGASCRLQRLSGGSLVDVQLMQVESFASEAMVLGLRLRAASELYDAEVLRARYAGTTGAEGGADLRGQLKPWVFGRALNVEPVFIDQINNVFQVSGYGPVQDISSVYERGSSFGASVGNFATYAALVAATIPPGRWATCLAQGMFRLGAPPAGVITCDVDGDSTGGFLRRTGAILFEIANRIGLVDKVNTGSIAALDAAVARNVNIVIREQISFLELAQRMLAPCNAVASVGSDGRLIASRVIFGSEQFTLDAQGREMPPVLSMERQNTSAPYKRVQMGANRSWRVHSFDEVAFYSELIDRGLYEAATVYREGNIVESADKSRWLYINPTPSSGNAPPTWPASGTSFWASMAPPLFPKAIGVEPGANVTETRISAGIAGQGPWATTPIAIDKLARPGVNVFPYPFAPTGSRTPASLGWVNAAASGTLSALGTTNGQWSGFNNAYFQQRMNGGSAFLAYPFYQMAWAAGMQTSVSLNGYGSNATFSPYIEFIGSNGATILGSANLTPNNATSRYECNGVVSPAGTAFVRVVVHTSYPASGGHQDSVWWAIKVEQGPQATPFTDSSTVRIDSGYVEYWNGATVEALRPGEFGANVTESRVASAINNQGALATQNNVNLGSQVVGTLGVLNADAGLRNNAITIDFGNGQLQGIGTSGVQVWNDLLVPSINTAGTTAVWNNVTGTGRPENFADVTANRTAAAIANQGALATQNQARASQLAVGGFDDIIPDSNYQDRTFWGIQGVGTNLAGFYDVDANWRQARAIYFETPQDFDYYSQFFDVEVGATYRVRARIWNNNTGAGWSGAFWPMIHLPAQEWFSLHNGQSVNPDVANASNAIVANGDTWNSPDYYFTVTQNAARRIQFRFKSNARGSGVIVQVQIAKVPVLGRDLMKSGLRNAYATVEIETSQGTAAAIAGQGALATRSNVVWDSEVSGRPNFLTDTIAVNGVDRINPWYVRGPNDDSLLGSRWPQEGGANVTENRVASAISGQGDLATRNAATLPFSPGNLVINSDFVNSTFGWEPAWDGNTGGSVNRGLNLPGWHGQMNVLFATRPGSPPSGTVFDAFGINPWDNKRFAVPVLPGERVYFSWLLGTHRCNGYAVIAFYDGDGAYIVEHAGSNVLENSGSFGGNPATMGRSDGFQTVPANARYVRTWVRAVALGPADPHIFCAQPFITKVPSTQTVAPPYSPGPSDRAADRTVDQPIVSQLNPTNGRTNNRRALSQIMTSGVLQLLDTQPITASTNDITGVATITINPHQVFDDAGTLSFSSATIGGLAHSTLYYVYEFNPDFVGGARSYVATTNRNDVTVYGRRFVGFVSTPAPGGPPVGGGGGGGGGAPGGEIP